MILLVDNYDSFTHNLAHLFGELGADVVVRRNDAPDLERLRPSALVVSPGPGRPPERVVALLRESRVPTLGVCLGHQCIGEAFGGRVIRAPEIMHGKTSLVYHDGEGLFAGLPNPLEAIRYHSLIVERSSLPETLISTAQTSKGLIMGLRHASYPVVGVQFHPESIMTASGKDLLRNFLRMARGETPLPTPGRVPRPAQDDGATDSVAVSR